MKIDKQWKSFERKLKDEFKFASTVAINDAAFAVRDELGKSLDETFDKGASKFTQKAFRVSKKAKKTDLEALVETKDIQSEYIVPALTGGKRKTGDYATSKRAGVMIPGVAAKTNKYGNMPRGWLKKQTQRTDTFLGEIELNGRKTLGVYRTKKLGKRSTKSRLQVLATFRDEVEYSKTNFYIEQEAKDTFDKVVKDSLGESIRDISKYGRVRSSYQRRKDP